MSQDARPLQEQEKKLRQLLELAEDNQQAVQDAIACLTAEREAFATERAALMKTATSSAEVSDTLRRATAQAFPAIEAAADKAMQSAVGRLMDMTADAAAQATPAIEAAADKAIQSAVGKLMGLTADAAAPQWSNAADAALERFGSVVRMAGVVEERMKAASHRLAWQWAALCALGLVATVVVAATSVQMIRSQQTELQRQQADLQRQQAELQGQKTAFSEDLSRMQASVTYLEKKGGRIRLSKCGPEQRLCIEVAPDQGLGRSNFRGVWSDDTNGRSYVIPKGY